MPTVTMLLVCTRPFERVMPMLVMMYALILDAHRSLKGYGEILRVARRRSDASCMSSPSRVPENTVATDG